MLNNFTRKKKICNFRVWVRRVTFVLFLNFWGLKTFYFECEKNKKCAPEKSQKGCSFWNFLILHFLFVSGFFESAPYPSSKSVFYRRSSAQKTRIRMRKENRKRSHVKILIRTPGEDTMLPVSQRRRWI